jgi:hypothetical protein
LTEQDGRVWYLCEHVRHCGNLLPPASLVEASCLTRIEFVTVYQDKDGDLRSGRSENGFALEARPMTDEKGRKIEQPINRGGTVFPQDDRATVTQIIIPDNNR